MSKPNILFIIADDHRYDAIGASGNTEVETPNLDALATNGVAFNKMYTMNGLTGAVCVPSRAALHTGVNPFRASASNKVEDYPNLQVLNPELTSFPKVMRESGYHTHAIGKWHNDKNSFAEGFTSGSKIMFRGMSDHDKVPVHDFDPTGNYPEENCYFEERFSTNLFCEEAIQFIDNYQKEEPFFLYVALTAPHDPRTPPKTYKEMYDPDDITLPENFMGQHPFDIGAINIRGEALASFPRTPKEIRKHIAEYYGMISHLDQQIGKVLQALSNNGLAQDTLIVYTSDHGLAVGQHGLMAKQNMYEHSLHIPFIINGKHIPKGKTVDSLACQYDIFPTICDLAEITPPENIEGQSLVPLLTGQKDYIRRTVFAVYTDVQRMIRDERWKLIKYDRSKQHDAGTTCMQLFDLENDPWEMNDLSNDKSQKQRLEDLLGKLQEWQKQVSDPLVKEDLS
ncbi:sulfatase-like hydrolase/transferase [Gracilibacillus phocaeensis]|uniref:sulfatase-like hydrolase/transferase n=1 Tax=Gracilibacillus phocaeensis TaxID=2042304 RepID=UPI0010314B72|nr:sulfatase-like hydrolase/transferase [Gracilibacillus phocaeensis]